MVKKTETYICDVCGKEVAISDGYLNFHRRERPWDDIKCGPHIIERKDLCVDCVERIARAIWGCIKDIEQGKPEED